MGGTFSSIFGMRKLPEKGVCSILQECEQEDAEAQRLMLQSKPLEAESGDEGPPSKRRRTDAGTSAFCWGPPPALGSASGAPAQPASSEAEDEEQETEDDGEPEQQEEQEASAQAPQRVKLSHLSTIRECGAGEWEPVLEMISAIDGKTFAVKTVLFADVPDPSIGQESVDQMEETILSSILKGHPYAIQLLQTLHSKHVVEDGDEKEVKGGGYARFLLEPAVTDLYRLMLTCEQSQEQFPEERLKLIAAQVLLVLEKLHRHNIIYRDIKPENVLLMEDGTARLCDFGSCYKLSTSVQECDLARAGPTDPPRPRVRAVPPPPHPLG